MKIKQCPAVFLVYCLDNEKYVQFAFTRNPDTHPMCSARDTDTHPMHNARDTYLTLCSMLEKLTPTLCAVLGTPTPTLCAVLETRVFRKNTFSTKK